jgi:hypothetical protein
LNVSCCRGTPKLRTPPLSKRKNPFIEIYLRSSALATKTVRTAFGVVGAEAGATGRSVYVTAISPIQLFGVISFPSNHALTVEPGQNLLIVRPDNIVVIRSSEASEKGLTAAFLKAETHRQSDSSRK